MDLPNITADDIIREADLIAKPAMSRASVAVDTLHKRGYHRYKTAMMDFRGKIEAALSELADDLMED